MIVRDEDVEEAKQRAEKALDYRTEDDRWNVLRDLLVEHASKQREALLAMLTTEIIRTMLYPGLTRDQWRAAGWNDALSGRVDPDMFIHKLRLARESGSLTGKL